MRAARRAKRPRRTAREQLRLARAQLAAVTRTLQRLPKATGQPTGIPSRFVQCWAVGRGYSGVTQALDEQGQVYERVCKIETVNGVKTVKESWWEPLAMVRRKP